MQYLVAYELADGLRPDRELRQRHSVFHALTGCETVSSFAARGKKSMAWTIWDWDVFPEFTGAEVNPGMGGPCGHPRLTKSRGLGEG